jgi:hypothetical protein
MAGRLSGRGGSKSLDPAGTASSIKEELAVASPLPTLEAISGPFTGDSSEMDEPVSYPPHLDRVYESSASATSSASRKLTSSRPSFESG